MGKFSRDNRSGGGDFKNRSFDRGGNGGFGGRDGGRPAMHQATCSECGKSCEVPFKPTGEKPVFCNDCFRNKRGVEPRRPSGSSFDRPSFNEKRSDGGVSKEQFEMLNTKLDRILKMLNPVVPAEVAPKKEMVAAKTDKPKKAAKKVAAPKKAVAKKKK